MIRVHLATMPVRYHTHLPMAVESLLPQVDELYVYANGCADMGDTDCLADPKVTIQRSEDTGNLGDTGKFWWVERHEPGLYFTVDDDFVYPPNYIDLLREAIEARDGRAILTCHGFRWRERMDKTHSVKCQQYGGCATVGCHADTVVHQGGTGVMVIDTRQFPIPLSAFRAPNMTDSWLAVEAQTREIPIIAVKHPNNWLLSIQTTFSCGTSATPRELFRRVAASVGEWRLFPDPLMPEGVWAPLIEPQSSASPPQIKPRKHRARP